MSEKNSKKLFSSFLDKLKRIKHLDIILTVLFISVVLLIYFSSTTSKVKQQQNTTTQIENENTFDNYSSTLTANLEGIISTINNAGHVKVLLYFDESAKTEIAYTYETKTLLDGSVVESKSPVLISKEGVEEPIVLQNIMPKPKSVVVVATGAKNTEVKLEILRLVEASLNLNSSNIEIFAGN